jgi:hypothetical protein
MKKVIAWDRDRTLGRFSILSRLLAGIPESEIPDNIDEGLKPGIKKLLSDLIENGFEHYVVTSAGKELAQPILKISGLEGFFQKQFAGSDCLTYEPIGIWDAPDKLYSPVIEHSGLTPNQAKDNLLIIGDQDLDKPHDLEGVVFIEHPQGYRFHSYVLRSIIGALLKRGNESLGRGFENMYETSKKKSSRPAPYYKIDFGGGIEIKLGYRTNPIGNVPTITIIQADRYRSKPEPLKYYPAKLKK